MRICAAISTHLPATYVTDNDAGIRSILEKGLFEECFVFSSLPEHAYANVGAKRPFECALAVSDAAV